jgi:hypothetical protein
MRRTAPFIAGLATVLATALTAGPVLADSGSGQSMTHIKTAPGLAPVLEAVGVVLYTRGGATSAVMGDSIAVPNGQVVFHVPVTASSPNVRHQGSTLVLFNTNGDRQVELRNPVIDLRAGVVKAAVGDSAKAITVLQIPNAKRLTPSVEDGVTTIKGARLEFAPGVGAVVESGLGLPGGTLPDGTLFATADVTLQA